MPAEHAKRPVAGEAEVVFHVAPNGDDRWSGRRERPDRAGKDGPLASLEGARDAVRAFKAAHGVPAGGVLVSIARGVYGRSGSFTLTHEDSGTPYAPIVYRAARRGTAVLRGGRAIGGFRPVRDGKVLSRLDGRVRNRVVECDLRAAGISDFGTLRSRGFSRPVVPAALELFIGGRPMPLARWPNADYAAIESVPPAAGATDDWGGAVGTVEGGFVCDLARVRRWTAARDAWVHGYWVWDWANTHEAVASLDPATGLVKTAPPHAVYGFRAGQRFFAYNILEELDAPGEWYLDRETGILYLLPPGPLKDGSAVVSILEEPVVAMKETSFVSLEGLAVECARGNAIEITGGRNVTVGGCALRNIGNSGVVVAGGFGHAVDGCDISYTGDCGVSVSGGDRAALVPCGHRVENCRIHRFSRWSKCYCPAILAQGVGMRLAHNLLHDAPHTAVLFTGNDISMECNEIHSVCMETGDAGAIYTGRDYTFRGNVVRHNLIHHTGGVGMGTMGVYNDDCVSGTAMIGNAFHRVTRAVMLGGGRDFLVEGNLFVECAPAIHLDSRGMVADGVWGGMVYTTMRERLEAMAYLKPPYSVRYPEMLELERYYREKNGIPPEHCRIRGNLCVGGTWLSADAKAAPYAEMEENRVVRGDPGFADPARLDFRLRKAGRARGPEIPWERIGPAAGGYRRSRPVRELIRARIELPGGPPADGESGGTVEARVIVENLGQRSATGRIGVRFSPDDAAAARPADIRCRLAPGETRTVPVRIVLSPGAGRVAAGIVRDGDDFFLRKVVLRRTCAGAVPVLPGNPSPDEAARAIADRPPLCAAAGGRTTAAVRIAVAGDRLAVVARVVDAVLREETPWRGSCVEIFGAMPDGKKIGQVFLVPTAEGWPAGGYLLNATKAEPAIRVSSAATADGYEIRALIPLRLLAVAPGAERFLFESQISSAATQGGPRRYVTLFGSLHAHANADRFAVLKVGE